MRKFRTKKQEIEKADEFIKELYSKYKNDNQLNNEDGNLENGKSK